MKNEMLPNNVVEIISEIYGLNQTKNMCGNIKKLFNLIITYMEDAKKYLVLEKDAIIKLQRKSIRKDIKVKRIKGGKSRRRQVKKKSKKHKKKTKKQKNKKIKIKESDADGDSVAIARTILKNIIGVAMVKSIINTSQTAAVPIESGKKVNENNRGDDMMIKIDQILNVNKINFGLIFSTINEKEKKKYDKILFEIIKLSDDKNRQIPPYSDDIQRFNIKKKFVNYHKYVKNQTIGWECTQCSLFFDKKKHFSDHILRHKKHATRKKSRWLKRNQLLVYGYVKTLKIITSTQNCIYTDDILKLIVKYCACMNMK